MWRRTPIRRSLVQLEATLNKVNHFDPGTAVKHFTIAMRDVLEFAVLPKLMRNLATRAPHVDISIVRPRRQEVESQLSAAGCCHRRLVAAIRGTTATTLRCRAADRCGATMRDRRSSDNSAHPPFKLLIAPYEMSRTSRWVDLEWMRAGAPEIARRFDHRACWLERRGAPS